MAFATISGTKHSLKTCSECRGKLAACGAVFERRASHLQPRGNAVAVDKWIEHAMRLGEDTGLVERMLGIADRLDDALLVDFATGFDVHFGGPMLRIVGIEPYVRGDLHLCGELGHFGISLRHAAIDIVEAIRGQRRKRDL